MARVISGKMRLEVQQVDLFRVIDAAIESIKPAADAKAIRIVPALDTSVPSLLGDPTRLQQVVWNLLSNAVKFTPREGRVEVVLRRSGSSAEICVRDTGKGIGKDFLAHVFDPFRQEDASYTRTRGGLGLGLAITRQLVESHGGRIEAQSDGEGSGATFTVSLPTSRSDAPQRTTERRGEHEGFDWPAQLDGLRVLVVDDEEDARQLVKEILEYGGCDVVLASNVEEAVTSLERERLDVLVSDVGMPEHDGFDLIRRVRALPPERGGEIPAAALTAYARAEDRRHLLNAGFSMHVPKPLEPAELIAVVASLARFIHRDPD
jgi:CheY-like chemotaxis protein